jgi:hypothetical protein
MSKVSNQPSLKMSNVELLKGSSVDEDNQTHMHSKMLEQEAFHLC